MAMRNALLLANVQLTGMLGLNRLRYGEKKVRRNALLTALAYLVLAGCWLVLVWVFSMTARAAGMLESVPALMLLASGVATLLFTVLKSSGVLFNHRDHDLLMALPLRQSEILLGRLLTVYLVDLLFAVGAMAPALALLVLEGRLRGLSLLTAPLLLLLAPVLPMAVGMAVGALLTVIFVRFKYRNVLMLLLTVAYTVAVMFWSFSMQSKPPDGQDLQQLTQLGGLLAERIYAMWPPARFFSAALLEGDPVMLLLFGLVNLAPMALFVALLSRRFLAIQSLLAVRRTGSGYQVRHMRQHSGLSALYRKELRRLFTSNAYLLNSCVGALMLVVSSIALAVLAPTRLAPLLRDPALLSMAQNFSPFALSFFVTMSCTTACAFNMEGAARWLPFSLPVTTRQILLAKVAVNLTVMLPAIALSAPLVAVTLRADFLRFSMMLLLPCAYTVFASVFGAAVNLMLPKYDWTSEQQAVKQAAAPFVVILADMALSLLPLLLLLVWPILPLQLFLTVLLLALSAALFHFLSRKRLYF